MAEYFGTLTATQKANINFIITRMKQKGITNPFIQAGILSVVSKESGFIPKRELSYKTTSNDRIRAIFGKLKNYSDADLNALKANDENFFNAIYGGMFGNAANEGYKYRGAGFNQLTFKGNFKAIGDKIGVDLVKYPEKLNELPTATDALLQYFIDRFTAAPADKLNAYGAKNINDFKNIKDSTAAAYHANAGWGKSVDSVKSDGTGGFAKAQDRASGFLEMAKAGGNLQLFFLRKAWSTKMGKITIITSASLITLAVAGLIMYKHKNK